MAFENHNNIPIRLFPSPRLTKAKSIPLSILDATCARFADTSAIWLYDPPSGYQVNDEFINKLKTTFVTTLNNFPQWAGQVHWAPFRPGGHHTERFNRSMITYGSDADPGVEWHVVRHENSIISHIPHGEYLSSCTIWSGDAFPQKELISKSRTPLSNLKDFEGMPGLMVQINLFPCGRYGVGVKLAHQLADASSMMVFVHQWAANSRKLFSGQPSSSVFDEPVFDPPQLDSRAAGDIDGEVVHHELADTARMMPLNRFSWWDTEEPGYSPRLVNTTENSIPPAQVLAKTKVSPSTIAPWKTWDLARPVEYGLLHFTGHELTKLQREARESAPEGAIISRTDALMAYIFRLVTRARAYAQSDDDEVFLNTSIDVRRRVSPPLPETFLGSPLLVTHIKGLASAVRCASLGELALKLRETLMRFTPDKVAAILHDAAYETSPQRLWLCFVGTLHIIATSWQRLRVYDVDFDGTGHRPAYVHSVMEKIDGTVVVLDPITQDGGVDVALYLDAEAMGHLKEALEITND
ncbi:transferase family protein [Truncatella angustata]|uniref:Transferase family protein n=1 Tax=Truncatella angustata TaxID=152316 RepID=A0A9P8USH5_9PEZI|nr:transferase family protein [Truncatella angustata]KAH6657642.1 transferase family protein [Truncatella angustata]